MGSYLSINVLLGCIGVYVLKRYFASPSHPPLPPGPKGKPVIGNLLDLPPPGKLEWVHWAEHKDLYGAYTGCSLLEV